MERFEIVGGQKLYGEVGISGAKNSVLPLIAASILSEGKTHIRNCPKIYDVEVMTEIIRSLGGKAYFDGNTLILDTADLNGSELPEKLTGQIRASLFTVGPLLTRFGKAAMCLPGGCNIGKRPIDIHVAALREIGVGVTYGEYTTFRRYELEGKRVVLRFPSVGATENLMMASVKSRGITYIVNCAKEPEIIDLQNYLNLIGAKISGAGTDVITVEGVEKLYSAEVEFTPSPDRIEAGTFIFLGAACGGELEFSVPSLRNSLFIAKIVGNNACKIIQKDDKIYILKFIRPKKGFGKIVTSPYPGFPTDLQPQLVACASVADGMTVVEDSVFPERFGYVKELKKTGADLSVYANACVAVGRKTITGTCMSAADLRGGAAMVITALAAEGKSIVGGIGHIDRGYDRIDEKLRKIGAKVARIEI